MKTFKNKWLMLFNSILSIVLAVFGFTSCGEEEGTVEYGCPHAEYELSGTVTDENGQSIKDENIIIQKPYSPNDTVKTAANGSFTYKTEMFAIGPDEMVIIADDPTNVYDNDTVKVVPQKIKEGDGHWFQGTYSNKVDFKLKKKAK